jgi:uncharacterized protein with NRDE domain
MCLIAWNWQPHSNMPLLLLSNRDEFYARPAMPLHWWGDDEGQGPAILAGKDLQGGGTWLGLSRSGRLAALTNYRSPDALRSDTPSRGELVAGFLRSDLDAATYLQQLAGRTVDYNPFNLLVYDGHTLMGLESRGAKLVQLQPGIGAVSNADFHTPWPKLNRLSKNLQDQITRQRTDTPELLTLLQDPALAGDADLPQTGVPIEWERALSASFIRTADYGTRACSVLTIQSRQATFTEHSFGPQGLLDQAQQTFALCP